MWYQFFTRKHQMCGSTHSSTSSSSGVDHEDVYDNLSPVEDPSAVASSTSTYRTHGLLCDVGRHAVSVHTDNVLRSSISLQTEPYRHKLQTVVQWLVSHKTCIPWQRASRLRPVIAPNVHSCLFIWTPSVYGATQPFQWTVCSCDQHTRSQRYERSQIFAISAPQQAPLAPLHHIVTVLAVVFLVIVLSCDQHTRSQRYERSQIFAISAPQQAPLAPLHHIVTVLAVVFLVIVLTIMPPSFLLLVFVRFAAEGGWLWCATMAMMWTHRTLVVCHQWRWRFPYLHLHIIITVHQFGGNHNSVYAILGHFRSM